MLRQIVFIQTQSGAICTEGKKKIANNNKYFLDKVSIKSECLCRMNEFSRVHT